MSTTKLTRGNVDRSNVSFTYSTSGWSIPSDSTPDMNSIVWGSTTGSGTSGSRKGSVVYTSYATSYGCEFKY